MSQLSQVIPVLFAGFLVFSIPAACFFTAGDWNLLRPFLRPPLHPCHPRAPFALMTAPEVDAPRRFMEREAGPRAVAQGSLGPRLVSDPGWGSKGGLTPLQLSLLPLTF